MATLLSEIESISSAQNLLTKISHLRQEVSDTIGMAMAYHNIGINHQLTNDNDSAIYFFQ